MDDIFKILIWIVIIISALSSFFKKKEPQQQTPSRRRQPGEEEDFPVKEQSAKTVDQEEYDILREIESLFKTDTSQPTKLEQRESRGYETTPTESEHISYEQTRAPGEYTSYEKGRTTLETRKMDTNRLKREQELTYSEHAIQSYPQKQKKVKQVDPAIARQAEAFEKFLKKKDSENSMALRIRNRLKEPASLKEFVIISEILQRPSRFKNATANTRAFRK